MILLQGRMEIEFEKVEASLPRLKREWRNGPGKKCLEAILRLIITHDATKKLDWYGSNVYALLHTHTHTIEASFCHPSYFRITGIVVFSFQFCHDSWHKTVTGRLCQKFKFYRQVH